MFFQTLSKLNIFCSRNSNEYVVCSRWKKENQEIFKSKCLEVLGEKYKKKQN